MSGITDPSDAFFKDGAWGWDGSVWRKLPLIWGYSNRISEDLGGEKDGNGTYSHYTVAVPAGSVHVVEIITLCNTSGARGLMQFYLKHDGVYYLLFSQLAPVQHQVYSLRGPFTLKEGDQVVVTQDTCIDNDVLKGTLWGYKMLIAE